MKNIINRGDLLWCLDGNGKRLTTLGVYVCREIADRGAEILLEYDNIGRSTGGGWYADRFISLNGILNADEIGMINEWIKSGGISNNGDALIGYKSDEYGRTL